MGAQYKTRAKTANFAAPRVLQQSNGQDDLNLTQTQFPGAGHASAELLKRDLRRYFARERRDLAFNKPLTTPIQTFYNQKLCPWNPAAPLRVQMSRSPNYVAARACARQSLRLSPL